MRFKMSDFKVLDRVSIGLGGRADEVVFEAIVKDSNRKLVSTQAKRRGMRAIEVLKKLVRRKLMYHSYSMQFHGYISSPSSGRVSFTLAHGYHGSFSLRHWLQQSDWLPTLEADLALDEESVRRVGDDTVGGPVVSRQLQITRILMRDLLIGVCMRDLLIGVGILGNAAGFYEDGPNSSTLDNYMDRRQMMIAFDMRCVGFMMAKMVLWELMDPLIFMKFKSFLVRRNRLSYFIELMEMLNAHSRPKNWLELLPGKWRLLYCTGRQIGLTLRQPSARVLIGDVYLTINRASQLNTSISFTSDIGFTVMNGRDWPHDKSGITGNLEVNSLFRLTSGRRLYLKEEKTSEKLSFGQPNNQDSLAQKLSAKKWRKLVPYKEFPSSLPVAKLVSADIEVTMSIGDNLNQNDVTPSSIVQEIRVQVPPEMFDLSRLVCGTYVDSRLLVLRGVNGSALLFTRSMC